MTERKWELTELPSRKLKLSQPIQVHLSKISDAEFSASASNLVFCKGVHFTPAKAIRELGVGIVNQFELLESVPARARKPLHTKMLRRLRRYVKYV